MHFVIHCLDREGMVETRLEHFEEHKAYLAAQEAVKLVVSGPLLADDGETMIGSCLVVEAENKKAVVDFNANDPFAKAGIWESVAIHHFLKRVDNRS